ncbi:hypothetical protein Q3G72_005740 [Acer saccharum]|nr:hypothetical protein Q3G72_005740 [Acer saccharum]
MSLTRYFVQLFCYSWFLAHAYSFVQSSQSLVSCVGPQVDDPAFVLDARLLTTHHLSMFVELKKKEGAKRPFIPMGILKLSTLSARPSSSSVLDLEARLGRSQGKSGVPASSSHARVSCSTSSKTASVLCSARPPKSALDKGKRIQKVHNAPLLSGGLASLSLAPSPDVVAKGSTSVVEFFLALEQLVVSFQEELRLSKRKRVDVEAQLKQVKHAIVHLSSEKLKVEQSQAAMAGQVVHWKHKLEKEVIWLTRRAHERNELRKRLAAKEKEVESRLIRAPMRAISSPLFLLLVRLRSTLI